MNELALFAGAGGGILGGHLLGWRTVCAVEIDPYASSILVARQNDGILPPFPVWDDVRTFDGRPLRGIVDVISGGFPCQDISVAGAGRGLEGDRSGLWTEFRRIIGEVRPRFAFVENSPALTSRGLGRILGDLAEMGYDAEWCVLGAHNVGAPHKRDRIWILAYALGEQNNKKRASRKRGWDRMGRDEETAQCQNGAAGDDCISGCSKRSDAPDSNSTGREKQRERITAEPEYEASECCGWWKSEPGLGRVADGMAHRVDRLKAIGNGQVPAVAAAAFRILRSRIG